VAPWLKRGLLLGPLILTARAGAVCYAPALYSV
jgi:hypothetical protein